LAAVLQADNHSDFNKKGFIALDIDNQRDIIQKYLSIFAKGKLIEREKLAVKKRGEYDNTILQITT
jgi:hypothetical protein